MDVPYTVIFLGLLVAYLAWSVWARLDGRYPFAAALGLLVVTAVVDAAGDTNAANSLVEFVFFLLAGGVVLLLIKHVDSPPATAEAAPSGPGNPQAPAAEAAEHGQRPAE